MGRNIGVVPDSPSLLAVPYQSAHDEIIPGVVMGPKTRCEMDAVLEIRNNSRHAGKVVALGQWLGGCG